MAKILIADDHPDLRSLLTRQLTSRGFACGEASNGQAVLDLLESEPIDLILMDMNMPELDGWQTTRQIRESQAHQELPIIAVTAYALAGDRARALNAGCNAFHCKPIDIEAVLLDIHKLLSNHCGIQKSSTEK